MSRLALRALSPAVVICGFLTFLALGFVHTTALAQPAISINKVPVTAVDTAVWSGPLTISRQPVSESQYPQVGLDAQDIIHVVWEDAQADNIMYVRRDPTFQWSAPEIVPGVIGVMPAMAVEQAGSAHIAFESRSPSGYGIYYVRRDNHGWSTPVRLSAENLYGDAGAAIAVDSNGHIVVAWKHFVSQDANVYQYVLWDGLSWSSPQAIPGSEHRGYTNARAISEIGLTSDGPDSFHAAWRGTQPQSYSTGIYYSHFDGGTWTSAFPVSSPYFGDEFWPNVKTDAIGNVTLLWSGNGSLKFTQGRGTTWSPIVLFGDASVKPSLVVDSSAHTLHTVYGPYGILQHSYSADGTTWTAPADVVSGMYPGVALDQRGDLHVVYVSIAGDQARVNYISTARVSRPPLARFTMSVSDGVVSANEGGALAFTVGEGTDGCTFNSKIRASFSAERSSDPDGDPLTYEWQINNMPTSTAEAFAADLGQGTHGITLVVQDDRGGRATAEGSIVITARNGATQPLALSWPFVSATGWANTGWSDRDCKPGTHCGDDWFAEDWNWGIAGDDLGAVLLSPVAGRVVFGGQSATTGYGNVVVIQPSDLPPNDFAVRLAHLQEVWVGAGETVCAGTPVGLLGSSGGQKSPHLHMAAYMGLFQSSARGSTGYHWLAANGSSLEKITTGFNQPTHFAIDFTLDRNSRLQGCGGRFALEGRVIKKSGKQVSGIAGVTLTLTGSQASSTTTSGRFAFNGLTPGEYVATPVKSGCTFTPTSQTVSVTSTHVELSDFVAGGSGCK